MTTYSVFIPEFENQEIPLISSTLDRYNDSIKNSLEKDKDLVQQKFDLNLQPNTNNFFRNAKW